MGRASSSTRTESRLRRRREPTSPPSTSRLGGGRRSMTVNGGPPPFQRFLDAHRDDVWRFLVSAVGRAEAEDCFQETFIAALRAYPRLRADSNLRAWVLTIAHRKALDAHRGRARRALPVAEPAAVQEHFAPAAHEHDGELWSAVGELPERQREAVTLR